MSESDFYTVNHRYEAQGAPGEWPTWELRAHGSAAPALAPDPAAPDDPPGGLGPGGSLPRPDPLGPWCSARLTFADGARVDVVVTVSDDRITVEDVRADPPLPLSGLTDLAGWIEGPLDDAFRAATGRPRRTRPTPRRPGPATAPERPAPAPGETPAEAAGTVRGDGTLHGAHPGAGTGRDGADRGGADRDGADRGGAEPSAEPAAGRVAEPTAEASGAPTTEPTGAPNGAPGIERTAGQPAEPTGAPATEVPAAPSAPLTSPSAPLAAPGPSAASAPAAAPPVTVPVSVAPVSSEPPVPSEASTSAAVITPSEAAASSEAAMPSEAATASEAAASSDTSMSSAAPAPSEPATPAGASASAPLPERARSSVLARSRAGERRRVAADAYRQAQREGRDPVLAVMHATGRNRRRSLRLIAGARDEGLLTPRHNKR
ncbi:DUF6214 family protein [Streptomyces angustmyceticus]